MRSAWRDRTSSYAVPMIAAIFFRNLERVGWGGEVNIFLGGSEKNLWPEEAGNTDVLYIIKFVALLQSNPGRITVLSRNVE